MDIHRKSYKAPWDALLIAITVFVCGLLISLALVSLHAVAISLTVFVIGLCVAFGVYGYRIEDDKLRIKRFGWYTDLRFDEITSVEFTPNAMKSSIRIFGIGGVFGYIGSFKNRLLSYYKAYATHRKRTVVISCKKHGAYVISPDNPEEFVQALKAFIVKEK